MFLIQQMPRSTLCVHPRSSALTSFDGPANLLTDDCTGPPARPDAAARAAAPARCALRHRARTHASPSATGRPRRTCGCADSPARDPGSCLASPPFGPRSGRRRRLLPARTGVRGGGDCSRRPTSARLRAASPPAGPQARPPPPPAPAPRRKRTRPAPPRLRRFFSARSAPYGCAPPARWTGAAHGRSRTPPPHPHPRASRVAPTHSPPNSRRRPPGPPPGPRPASPKVLPRDGGAGGGGGVAVGWGVV